MIIIQTHLAHFEDESGVLKTFIVYETLCKKFFKLNKDNTLLRIHDDIAKEAINQQEEISNTQLE